MTSKVFIEKHLDSYLKNLAKEQLYIPGVIIGQVIGDNYHVVHLSAITVCDEDTKSNKSDILAYKSLTELLANSDLIFQKSIEIRNFLPGGSNVLGLFFIVLQDLKSVQPINIDFYEFSKQLNENVFYDKNNKLQNYLLINYSTVNKKSFCYTVDFNRSNGHEQTTYKSIDDIFGSFDNDWVTFVGTFNFGVMDWLNNAGGPKALFSICENLLKKFESILNESVITFNGSVCEENKTLKDFECYSISDILKNVVNIEFYREVNIGNCCKHPSLKVVRGKGKVLMSGLCSLAIPFNRNGTIKDAIQAIHADAMKTFATRIKMHLDSMVEEESLEEEDSDVNVVHETPRRILILKTEGSRFAFSDYLFPGEDPQEALTIAGEILNLCEEKMELYDMLEKGRHPYYETLPDIDGSPPLDAITVPSNNINLIYFICTTLIFVILAYIIKQFV